jgi:hypothetical protein
VKILQDDVNNKTVALSIKGAKITGRMLAKAMQAFLKKAREPTAVSHHCKQSVKTLTKQGASLSSIEITGNNIGTFKRTARKYNVDFALKRDDSADPPRHIVFFKAKDADALTAAFSEYSKTVLKTKAKPPLLVKLDKFKKLAKSLAAPVKHRSKGDIEH